MDEFSELEHIRISNRGDGSKNNSPEQPGSLKYYYGLSVFHENLNLSNIWYDYDSFYVGAHKSKFIHKYQIFLKELLKSGLEYQTAGYLVLRKHLPAAVRYRDTTFKSPPIFRIAAILCT